MTAAACPICRKPAVQAYDPFCSKRCADVDLSRWLKGSYAIAGEPAGEDEDGTSGNTKDSGDFED